MDMNRPVRIILFVASALLLPTGAAAQRVIYVNAAATGAGDGMGWPDAYPHLQDALASAVSGDEIWVAAGTYRPDQGAGITPGDRGVAFVMEGGVSLYGGFAGDEVRREDRDWVAHPTMLSGDLLENDDEDLDAGNPLRSDNSRIVVIIESTTGPITFDGFTIQRAHALESENNTGIGLRLAPTPQHAGEYLLANLVFEYNVGEGGALVASAGDRGTTTPVVLRRVLFRRNRAEDTRPGAGGGGLRIFTSYVRLEDVDFLENWASVGGALLGNTADIEWVGGMVTGNIARAWGGAVMMEGENDSHLEAANLMFLGNRAEVFDGGALFLDEASLFLVNSTFAGNRAATQGGALVVAASQATLSNCILYGNHAEMGGGVLYHYASTDTVHIDNSIIWGNSSTIGPREILNNEFNGEAEQVLVRNSLLGESPTRGVIDGGGIIFDDPQFVDGERGDFRLSIESPAIDAGLNALVSADRIDIDGDGNLDEPLPADIAGNRRIFAARGGEAVVDMGAYEFGSPSIPIGVVNEETRALNASQATFVVFPNPVADKITIRLETPGKRSLVNVEMVIYDTLGRQKKRIRIGQIESPWHYEAMLGDEFVNGVYALSLFGEHFFVNGLFVVVK